MQAGSGERNSMRVEDSLPRFTTGTRMRADWLLRPHDTKTGASKSVWLPVPVPWTRRL